MRIQEKSKRRKNDRRNMIAEEDNPDKNPVVVRGLPDVYSPRRLSEAMGK